MDRPPSSRVPGLWGREPRREGARIYIMSVSAEDLRKAIENLIDAKLHDALYRPGGLDRLRAHRLTGVASPDIRNAERRLEEVLEEVAAPQQRAVVGRRRPRKLEGLEMVSTD